MVAGCPTCAASTLGAAGCPRHRPTNAHPDPAGADAARLAANYAKEKNWKDQMKQTEPKVYLIARPALDWEAIRAYLESVGGISWYERISRLGSDGMSQAEALIEFAGRLCYRSWEPGLNPNVTKVRDDSYAYIRNILTSGHGSVLEHAQFTFLFQDVSRVFTHELVRHRAGVAISQESLRYVRLTDIGFRMPPALAGLPRNLQERLVSIIEQVEDFQAASAEATGLDTEGTPFHIKKEVTSALRRIAPMGLSTSVLWSANFRTIRHVLSMRTALGAEEEMRLVFGQVGRMMYSYPIVFQDYEENADGEFVTKNRKV